MMRRTSRAAGDREGGFTLLELLVVVVILGILSAVVVFAVRGVGNKGQDQAVATDKRVIRTAQEAYCARAGQYGNGKQLAGLQPAEDLQFYKFLSEEPTYHEVTAVNGNPPNPGPPGPCNGWRYTIDTTVPTVPTVPTTLPTTTSTLPPPVRPLWEPTAAMGAARQGHSATLLDNGEVLVVGGLTNTQEPSAEVYNPVSGTWRFTDEQPVPIHGPAAVRLRSGKVLVVVSRAFADDPVPQIYTPRSGNTPDRWDDVELPPNLGPGFFNNHTATLLKDGKVLVTGLNQTCVLLAGGSSSAVVFDPQAPTGAQWGPPIPMLTERTSLGVRAVGLQDGRVLVAGGQTCSFAPRNAGAEIFDPTGVFTATGPPRYDMRVDSAMTALSNGKVLMTGPVETSFGVYKLNAVQLFDPGSNSWAEAPDTGAGRRRHSATRLDNGKVLVAGFSPDSTASAELYDPTTGTWSATVPMVLDVSYAAAVRLGPVGSVGCGTHCGSLLVAGGNVPDRSNLNTVAPTSGQAQLYLPPLPG